MKCPAKAAFQLSNAHASLVECTCHSRATADASVSANMALVYRVNFGVLHTLRKVMK